MENLTIGEIARQAGINPSAVRYYESIGLLPPATRINRRRRYDLAILPQLKFIRVGQQAGFTLLEIKTLLNGFAQTTPPYERWQTLAQQKLTEIDALIRQAQAMKQTLESGMRCHCLRLDDCQLLSEG